MTNQAQRKTKQGAMPESRNWADLPGEIANFISKKLPLDCVYLMSFRAVCKNWRTAAPLSDLPPQLPWLIECEHPDQNSHFGANLRFYSLAGDTSALRVPEPYRGMVYYGPGHGYLLVSSLEDDLFLIKPLASDVISLPRLSDGLRIRSPGCSGTDPKHNWYVSCNAIGADIEGGTTAIYRADQNDWTCVVNRCILSCNTCCWDGKVFATGAKESTAVFNAVSGQKLFFEAPPPVDELWEDFPPVATYLVESCGDILRVTLFVGAIESEEFGPPKFEIYKLYYEGGLLDDQQGSWVKVSDIGDQIVFLDRVNGFAMRAPAGFRGNCVYYLSENGDEPSRYDLGTEQVEKLSCPFGNCTWFVPHIC